ncbi:hypothetical protein KAU88_06595 [Candidatus Bathyarchaeota archaeon]|nr:hypothetical protein [Candidatus Bathyarchaeota archaeon]
MINKTKRAIIYAVVEVALGVMGFAVSLLPGGYALSATFIVLGLIFSVMLEVLIEITTKEALPVDIISGERELKKTYEKLRKNACLMQAVWCSRYAEVSKYFNKEMKEFRDNKKLTIERLINPKIIPSPDYKAHLNSTERLRKLGRYKIKATDLTELECVVCEYESKDEKSWKALFVFNDLDTHTPALGILLDPSKKEKAKSSLAAVKGWFKDEWNRGIPL